MMHGQKNIKSSPYCAVFQTERKYIVHMQPLKVFLCHVILSDVCIVIPFSVKLLRSIWTSCNIELLIHFVSNLDGHSSNRFNLNPSNGFVDKLCGSTDDVAIIKCFLF